MGRRLVIWGAGLAFAAAVVTGCGGGNQQAANGSAANGATEARPSVVVGFPSDPGYLAFQTSGIGTYTYTRLAYQGLFRIRPDTRDFQSVRADAAQSWTVSADGTTWTFKLRPGLKFSDGSALSSADVKYSIGKLMTPKFNVSSFLSGIASAEAPDPRTVIIKLKEADPTFWVTLAETIDIYPMKVVRSVGDAAFGQKPVGSGPYQVVSWNKNDSVEYVANRHYTGPFRPKFQRLTIRVIPDASARLNALKTSAIDAAPVEPQFAQELAGVDGMRLVAAPGATINYVILRYDRAPTDDARVRQALNYAIDRKALAQTFFGGQADLPAAVIPSTKGGAAESTPYGFDPERAKGLVRQYGRPVRLALEFPTSSTNNDVAQALQKAWQDVGMQVTLKPEEESVYNERVFGGINGDGKVSAVALQTWSGVTESLGVYLFTVLPDGIFGYVNSNAIAEAVEQASAASDTRAREAAINEAEQACLAEACRVPLWVPKALFGEEDGLNLLPQSEGVWDIGA